MTADDGATNNSVVPNDIAECALHHYHHNLTRGKPRCGDEWTIYAAIVAASFPSTLKVVTCATGTKCTTVGPEGWVLRDSHAEVLCRRGLIRVLLQETTTGNLRLLETSGDSHRLRADTTLHLYVSDSPCGDASIYPIQHEEDMNFTGAKVIVQKDNNNPSNRGELLTVNTASTPSDYCVAREDTQELGVLRTKSGRSNLPQHLRSSCMSCSDKLLRWCVLGLQGSWLPFDVRLSSVVVSRDPNATSRDAQQQALERAVCGRVCQVVTELRSRNAESEFVKRLKEHVLTVHVVEEQFPDGKSESIAYDDSVRASTDMKDVDSKIVDNSTKKRKRDEDTVSQQNNKKQRRQQKSSCGVSINWQWSDGETEVLVGARGVQQGKKPKTDSDYVKMTSRLSRGALVQLVNSKIEAPNFVKSYRDFKTNQTIPSYAENRSLILSTQQFDRWLVGNTDFDITQAL